jgi:hypothetical protein
MTPPAADRQADLFDGGPPTGLQTALGLMRAGHPRVLLRLLLLWIVTWLPLLLLAAFQSVITGDDSLRIFVADYGVHARLLVAAPLLVVAEVICLPRISAIADHFLQSGIVPPEEADAFHRVRGGILRLYRSAWLEALVAGLALAIAVILAAAAPPGLFPAWHQIGGGQFSPAGWWHALVSVPILLTLLLGWGWRLLLWTRFLYRISRLQLRLIASHPDRVGGLRFVGAASQTFSVLAFALAMIVAGTVANRVVHDGASLLSFRYVFLGVNLACLLLFVSPALVFTPVLLEVWREGVCRYGALARDVGENFERKWLRHPPAGNALEANDFSATTDLYSIAANVYAISFVPVGWNMLLAVAIGAALPFIPVLLLAVPPQQLVQLLASRLF